MGYNPTPETFDGDLFADFPIGSVVRLGPTKLVFNSVTALHGKSSLRIL